jgi:Putative polyhydroxyalkanoic acid system protein (PHA_gran_rgn)
VAELRIEVATGKATMAESLDEALRHEFPGGLLQRRWDGDTLHLSGPGATGTITLEAGRLVGRAELAPPASMMRGVIEQKVGEALRRAAGE